MTSAPDPEPPRPGDTIRAPLRQAELKMEEGQGPGVEIASELRTATFPRARRGYDQAAVRDFLDAMAVRVLRLHAQVSAPSTEAGPGEHAGTPPAKEADQSIRNAIEGVGTSIAHVLGEAEEVATKVRSEADEYASQLKESTDEETSRELRGTEERVGRIIAAAESRAEQILGDLDRRGRALEDAEVQVVERRDRLIGEAERLLRELQQSLDHLRPGDPEAEVKESSRQS